MSKTESVAASDQMIEEDSIDLSELVGTLHEKRWFIGGVTFAFFLLALIYGFIATPIYRANALLQVEEQSPFGRGRMDELEAMMTGEPSLAVTEIEIIRSRKVIGAMVDAMNLTVQATPKYFPLIGRKMATGYDGSQPASPRLGFDNYAWGGEAIRVDRFDVPSDLVGEPFTLIKGEGKNFSLLFDDKVILTGTAGRAATSEDGRVQLFVSQLDAREATSFTLIKQSRALLIEKYQRELKAVEKERRSGIIELSLEGADRMQIMAVLKAIIDSYLKQNINRHSEQSEHMLTFISGQLPEMKRELSAAESDLNKYREEKGTIDISFEAQQLIKTIVDIEMRISELELQKAALSNRLTPKHPSMLEIDQKITELDETHRELELRVVKLPETELEAVKLKRDVTVANELYMLLLNKSQELKVTKAGTIGSVRTIDESFAPEKPIKPKRGLIAAVGLLLGLIVSVVVVFMRKTLNKTIHDPKVIENMGLPVYAEIPFSEEQHAMDKKNKANKKKQFTLLAQSQADEHVVESLRSLRTSIQFAMMEASNNVILISGPSPDIGKSFVSANFAYVMSDTGKKVLLIDTDMRKGHLSAYFNCDNEPGLSELISGSLSFDEVVRKNVQDHQHLDVVTSGTYPPNPTELLMSNPFEQFLKYAQSHYDLIIIDTPPILAVTDAAIIARYSDANFIVLRSERHHAREIEETIKRFKQNGISLKGAIFNGISLRDKQYGYGYRYYGYSYSYKPEAPRSRLSNLLAGLGRSPKGSNRNDQAS